MSEVRRTSLEVRLAAVPDGLPTAADLAVVETQVPPPGPGELLIRNRFFALSPALRTLIGGGVTGTPLPALRPGDPLIGLTVGEVVAAGEADSTGKVTGANEGGVYHPGDLVQHMLGWREYAVLPAAACSPANAGLTDPVANLAQGTTVYGGFTRAARLKAGDTVFVSGGAGAVGSLAGQVARLLGAARVIGSTGSAWKAERMTADLGYDAVLVRGAGPVEDQLAKAAPDGIDVFFDNTGGAELRAAVAVASRSARFALIGALSGQLAPDASGAAAPVEIDSYQLILKQITLTGYSAMGDREVAAEWADRFAGWLRSGAIRFPYERIDGMEQAPRAFHDMMAGRYLGTVVVAI
jgi:NADPH-dependent curcumin reductase CurA